MFQNLHFDDHEEVVFAADASSGLNAILAVHDTTLGPSLGGCRVWTYDSDEAALNDALRLSRAMTYKSAMADLPLGGGKSVVMVPTRGAKTGAMFEALGKAIQRLGGRYIVAEDVGSEPSDMKAISTHTDHVTGLSVADGGLGDPSATTADGCFIGVRATAAALGRELEGLHVAVQGLGNVGFGLAKRLHRAGARLTVADPHAPAVSRAVEELGAKAVPVGDILTVEADILSPNALGGVLNERTIGALKVAAVAGAANNQLARSEDGELLRARGILFAPDYLVNAGGVTKMCGDYFGWESAAVTRRVEGIADRLSAVFATAAAGSRPTNEVADEMALEKVRAGANRLEPAPA
ncbi:MAG: Glu/Leu/Phe/Val dehydrogenase dimerization domain-containing protein [Pseudomonadota bacterium]